ncbi:MAG: ATP-binding cassette domain-containing protein [Litorimonas sp.]
MLELSDIGKRYGKTRVLSGIDHRFDRGVTVITGPSGAGKSTLLRLCATVEKPSEGQLSWNGAPLRGSLKAYRSALGYAPQRIDFPEDLSGLDFMMHVAALKGLPLGSAKAQAQSLLDRLGLGRDATRLVRTYSGGMRRRLGLAQSALGDPAVLILDEPTAELDAVTGGHVNDLVFELGERAVVLMTTHLQDSLADRPYRTLDIRPAD